MDSQEEQEAKGQTEAETPYLPDGWHLADAWYHNFGGSQFWLIPVSEEAYNRLRTSGIEYPQPGRESSNPDMYPSINFNAPTLTNTKYDRQLRPRYNAIMKAMQGLKLRDYYPPKEGETTPYPIGNPDAIWP